MPEATPPPEAAEAKTSSSLPSGGSFDPPVAPKSEAPILRYNITIKRFAEYGASPGCKACDAGGPIAEVYNHSRACRRRFASLILEHEGSGSLPTPAEAPPAIESPSDPGPFPVPSVATLVSENGSEDNGYSSASEELSRELKQPPIPGLIAKLYSYTGSTRVPEACIAATATLQQVVNDTVEEAMNFVSELDAKAVESAVTQTYTDVVSAPAYKVPTHRAPKGTRDSETVLLEFCCAPNSELGETAQRHGIKFLRLNQSFADVSDPAVI